MQQIKLASIAEHRLLELMNATPWDAPSFRLGEHWGALNRRAYLAAKAAHKNQRQASLRSPKTISNNSPTHMPSGRTSSDLVKTNRIVADT